MDDNSVEMAQRYFKKQQDYSKRVIKKTFVRSEIRDIQARHEERKARSNASNLLSNSEFNLPKPLIRREPQNCPTVFERLSEEGSNRPSTINLNEDIAIKPDPLSYWGFVPVGEELRRAVSVYNLSRNTIEMTLQIMGKENEESAFRVRCFYKFL